MKLFECIEKVKERDTHTHTHTGDEEKEDALGICLSNNCLCEMEYDVASHYTIWIFIVAHIHTVRNIYMQFWLLIWIL